MTSLAERVLEAIGDVEEIAEDAASEGIDIWKPEDPAYWWNDDYPMSRNEKRLIAMHDPAAVLRRCAADRKILDLHQAIVTGLPTLPLICETCGSGECDTYPTAWPCPTLAALAEAYGVPLEQEETNDGL